MLRLGLRSAEHLGDQRFAISTARAGNPAEHDPNRLDHAGLARGSLLRRVARSWSAFVAVIAVAAGVLTVKVDDDGVGGSARARAAPGDGLINMASRAGRLGGSFELGDGAAGGTALKWTVPLGN